MQADILCRWLAQWPGFCGQGLLVDDLEALPESGGLFPRGQSQVAQRTDILGRVQVTQRLAYGLRLQRFWQDQTQAAENAAQLEALRQWVQGQSAAGLTPRGPTGEPVRAQLRQGSLRQSGGEGAAIYEAALTLEYETIYEVN